MKKFLLNILICMPMLGIAQPVITPIPLPIGDSILIYSCDKPLPGFSVSGFNNWDFSTLAYDPNPTPMKILLPSNTPYAADFPTADMCERYDYPVGSGGTSYVYYKQNSDSLFSFGYRYVSYPSLNADWINPSVYYQFPFVLNQSFVDDYLDNTGFQDSIMYRYVGWGSIKTPLGNTYTDVFLYENNVFNSSSNTWTVLGYQWVSVARLQAIFNLFYPNPSAEFYEKVGFTSGITQQELDAKYQVSVYPNPSIGQSFIDINIPGKANVSIELISVNGKTNTKLVSDGMMAGKCHIPVNTANVDEGTYFVRIVIDNMATVKTIEVAR